MTTSHRVQARVFRAIAAGVALTSTLAWGYYYIFSRFSWYDDEGYVMMSVHQVAEGRALYDDVYSQYGPFYYVMRLALLTILQAPVSHDVTRLITLATWIGTAALAGLFLVRMGGSAVAALIGYLMVFHHLRPLAHEPGHPQELGLLLITSLVAIAACWNAPRRARALMIVSGIVVSGLTLTKINVGVYAMMALAIAFVTFAPTRLRASLLVLMAMASVALPWSVMRDHVGGWAFGYAALVSLGSLAVVVVCHGTSSERPLGASTLWSAILAAAATTLATCLVMLVRGTSAMGLVNGVLLQPLAFAEIFFTEVRIANQAVVAAGLSLVLALASRILRKPEQSSPTTATWLFWWLKLAGGLLGIFLAFQPPRALLGLGPLLLWLVLVRPLHGSWRYAQLMPRVVLVTLASLQTLQAYPVAGSQVAWATFLMIPASLLCTVDALEDLWTTRAGSALQARRSIPAVLEAAALVGVLIAYERHLDLVGARERYRALSPLALPGSLSVRLSPDEVGRYRWLVGRVQERCGTLITLPGLNSLYLWTELEPPTGLNTTAWPVLLGRDQQQRIVDAVRPRHNLCIIEYPAGVRTFGRDEVISTQPLMRFVRDEFQVVDEHDGYRVMLRRAATGAGS